MHQQSKQPMGPCFYVRMPAGIENMNLSSPRWLVRAAALPGGAQEVEGPRGVTGRYHARTPASISSNHFNIRDSQTPSC